MEWDVNEELSTHGLTLRETTIRVFEALCSPKSYLLCVLASLALERDSNHLGVKILSLFLLQAVAEACNSTIFLCRVQSSIIALAMSNVLSIYFIGNNGL